METNALGAGNAMILTIHVGVFFYEGTRKNAVKDGANSLL
jgi:hypothetical protein